MRIARAVLLGILIAGALAAGTGYLALTSPWGSDRIRRSMVGYLSDKFDADVAIAEMSIKVVPRLSIDGRGMTLTRRSDPASGPFVTLENFKVSGSVLALMRRHVDAVSVDGFEFRVKKGNLKGRKDRKLPKHDVSIGEISVRNGVLLILPNNPEKLPLQFDLEQVTLEDFAFDRPSAYRARLTNPKPRGYIDSTGEVGPWDVEELRLTPVSGGYTFENADMSTIKGIGGRLNSTGKFEGELERIRVVGVATVPDFQLAMTKQPVKLETKFRAIVDGTSGDTYLDEVDAVLGQSKIRATGQVAGAPKAKGRSVLLDVQVTQGRLEDMLRLAVKAPRPPMRGALTLRSAFDLPPGEEDVPERLLLKGSFNIKGGQFTSDTVQDKVDELEPPRPWAADQHRSPERAVGVRWRVLARQRRAAVATIPVQCPRIDRGPERQLPVEERDDELCRDAGARRAAVEDHHRRQVVLPEGGGPAVPAARRRHAGADQNRRQRRQAGGRCRHGEGPAA